MKREYIKPIAMEELFLANSYVAKCQTPITSKVTSTGMQCINPKHTYHKEGEYFSNLWVMGDKGSCAIVVNNDSPTTSGTWFLREFFPDRDTTVYAQDGKAYSASESYKYVYYVPSFVNDNADGGLCYGAYEHKGTTEDIVGEPVFS